MKLQEIETSVLDQKKRLVKKLFYGKTTMMMMMRKAIIIDLKSYRITDTITSSIDAAAAAWNINHTFVFIYFSFVLFSFVINDY